MAPIDVSKWVVKSASTEAGVLILVVTTPSGDQTFVQHSTLSIEELAGKLSPTGRLVGAALLQALAGVKGRNAAGRAAATQRAGLGVVIAEATGKGDLGQLMSLLEGPHSPESPPDPKPPTAKAGSPRSKGGVVAFRGKNSK